MLANAQAAAKLLRENGVNVPSLRLRASHVGTTAELTRYVGDAERDVLASNSAAAIARLRFLRALVPFTRRANPAARVAAVSRQLLDRRIATLRVTLTGAERDALYGAALDAWQDDLATVLSVEPQREQKAEESAAGAAADDGSIVLSFDVGEGVLAYGLGTKRHKETIKTLGGKRWRFSRRLPHGPGWYIPNSRSLNEPPIDLEQAANTLRGSGATVRVRRSRPTVSADLADEAPRVGGGVDGPEADASDTRPSVEQTRTPQTEHDAETTAHQLAEELEWEALPSTEEATVTELIPSVRIESIVAQRNVIAERLVSWRADAVEIDQLVKAIAIDNFDLDVIVPGEHYYRRPLSNILREDFLETVLRAFDKHVWQFLVEKSGVWSLMDEARKKSWTATLDAYEAPELTTENVQATFRSLIDARHQMVDDSLTGVWQRLSWDHKTNNPVLLNKRGKLISRLGGPWDFYYDKLEDLERVLRVLDGVPQEDHRNGWRQRFGGISAWDFQGAEFESDYLRVKVYKNRNGHIYIKDAALIAKVNAKLAEIHPKALPAPRR